MIKAWKVYMTNRSARNRKMQVRYGSSLQLRLQRSVPKPVSVEPAWERYVLN